jgi:hypothetical protein
MNNSIKYILIALLLLTFATFTKADEVRADGELEQTEVKIGDQFNFSLQLTIPENTPYRWPVFTDTIATDIEIIRSSKIDTVSSQNNSLVIRQDFTLSIFDTGFFVIPPIPFQYGNSLDNEISSEPFLVNVFSVGINLQESFKPIIGPYDAPITFMEILPWGLAGIVLLLIVFLIVRYLMNKKSGQPLVVKKAKPAIPPHRLALEELEKLKNEKLWQRDLIKEYHSRLGDILRQYVENHFKVPALEMTTWETIKAFSGVKIESHNLSILRETLEMADLVKFAKYKPLPDQHNKSFQNAIDFVKKTMPGIAIGDTVHQKQPVSPANELKMNNAE